MALINKSQNALKTISEVSEILNIETHILRFWETQFKQISPLKNRGRRYYSNEQIEIIGNIKTLLYEQGYSIKQARQILKENDLAKKASKNSNVIQLKLSNLSPKLESMSLNEHNRSKILIELLNKLYQSRRQLKLVLNS